MLTKDNVLLSMQAISFYPIYNLVLNIFDVFRNQTDVYTIFYFFYEETVQMLDNNFSLKFANNRCY